MTSVSPNIREVAFEVAADVGRAADRLEHAIPTRRGLAHVSRVWHNGIVIRRVHPETRGLSPVSLRVSEPFDPARRLAEFATDWADRFAGEALDVTDDEWDLIVDQLAIDCPEMVDGASLPSGGGILPGHGV